MESDATFASDNRTYKALDKRIRTLELNDSPIDDQTMHQFKYDRAVLKNSLYQRLVAASAK